MNQNTATQTGSTTDVQDESKTSSTVVNLSDFQAVNHHSTALEVYRPDSMTVFRIRPDQSSKHDYYVLERPSGTYLVNPGIAVAVKAMKKALYVAEDIDGQCFIVPVAVRNGRPSSWVTSGADLIEKAQQGWVRMESNRVQRRYETFCVPHTKQATFSVGGFDAVIKEAFAGKTIATVGHPAVTEATGR